MPSHESSFRIERGDVVLEVAREGHEFVADLSDAKRGHAITVLQEEAAELRDWLDAQLRSA